MELKTKLSLIKKISDIFPIKHVTLKALAIEMHMLDQEMHMLDHCFKQHLAAFVLSNVAA